MFRFTIRDVLWLTVVAALAVGWWIDRCTQLSSVKELQRANEALSVEAREQADKAEEAWRILTETVNTAADLNWLPAPAIVTIADMRYHLGTLLICIWAAEALVAGVVIWGEEVWRYFAESFR
jgi:hypothetical protein